MFQSEKKLSGSTQKMNKTDTSSTTLTNGHQRYFKQTNVSIWKEVVWFYSEDEQDRYLSY